MTSPTNPSLKKQIPSSGVSVSFLMLISLFLAITTFPSFAQLSAEQVTTLKKSCGFLFSEEGSGTAFVISEGVLATCAHVVPSSGEVEVAFADEKGNWETHPAILISKDEEADVALLRVEGLALPVLPRASKQVTETAKIVALGYPFGQKLATEKDGFPDVSLSMGNITSIRKVGEEVKAIQVDAELHPGYSGGPVVDDQCKVIGLVEGGLPLTNLNTAIPIREIENLLEKPEIKVTSAEFDPAQGGDFSVEIRFPKKLAAAPVVQLVVSEKAPLALTADEDGQTYRTKIPAAEKSAKLVVEVVYEDGSIKGMADDRSIRVGDKAGKLSKLVLIECGETNQVTGTNGATIAGRVSGLNGLKISTSGGEIQPSFDKAKEIRISSVSDEAPTYRVVVMAGDQTVGEVSGVFHTIGEDSGGSGDLAGQGDGVLGPRSKSIVEVPGGKMEIKLPGIASDVAVGENGRAILISMEEISKIAVFDNQTLKFRGFIPMAATPAVIAANLDLALIYYPAVDTLISYRLKDLKRIGSKKAPFDTNIIDMAGGHASRGPVATVVAADGGALKSRFGKLNPSTLQGEYLRWNAAERRHPFMSGTSNQLRMSADGRIVTNMKTSSSPNGYSVIIMSDPAVPFYEHTSAGVIAPSWDGAYLYAGKRIYRRPYNKIAEFETPAFNIARLIPAYHPKFYMSVMQTTISRAREEDREYPCHVHLAGNSATLLEIEDAFEEMKFETSDQYDRGRITVDKRYILNPYLGTLITLPKSNDTLFVRSCDIFDLIDNGALPSLFITNSPSPAKKGSLYRFQLDAPAAKKDGISFALESGPEGMSLSDTGAITWRVPMSQDQTEFIIVKVSSNQGEQKLYTFAIAVGD